MRHFGHGERRKMARVAALTLAAVLLRPALGWAMFDAFLKIDGVQGESTDARHSGEIEALAYHWGATQAVTGTVSDKGNITGSRVNMDALTITKALDSSSPLLAQNCAEGKVYPTVTLVLQRSGGSREKYMEYKLTNALVSSIQSGGAANGEDGVPTEEVSLSFSKIEWAYTKIGPDGRPAGNTLGSWDLSKNQK